LNSIERDRRTIPAGQRVRQAPHVAVMQGVRNQMKTLAGKRWPGIQAPPATNCVSPSLKVALEHWPGAWL